MVARKVAEIQLLGVLIENTMHINRNQVKGNELGISQTYLEKFAQLSQALVLSKHMARFPVLHHFWAVI